MAKWRDPTAEDNARGMIPVSPAEEITRAVEGAIGRIAGATIAEGAGMSESWGYRCETCGDTTGFYEGANTDALRRVAGQLMVWVLLAEGLEELFGPGHACLPAQPVGWLLAHQDHRIILISTDGRTEPLFPDNAPLPHGSRGFLHALADDCLDVAALGVFFDLLEEAGLTEAGLRVRKLTPQTGDVLALSAPPGEAQTAGAIRGAKDLYEFLVKQGIDVQVVVLRQGWDVAALDENTLRGLGLVRAVRVAEAVAAEREACRTAILGAKEPEMHAAALAGLQIAAEAIEGRTALPPPEIP